MRVGWPGLGTVDGDGRESRRRSDDLRVPSEGESAGVPICGVDRNGGGGNADGEEPKVWVIVVHYHIATVKQ